MPASSIAVEDVCSTGPEVDAALWRFVFDIELVEEVTAHARPLDEPLRRRLAEPRRRAKGGEETDVTLGLSEQSAIFIGGCRPSLLAAAGRAHERRPGALARADAAFASPMAAFCGAHF